MNKLIIAVVATLVAAATFAKEAQGVKVGQMTPEQKRERLARISAARYRTTGGMIVKPNSQQGKIAFFDCGVGKGEVLKQVTDDLAKAMRFNFQADTLPSVPARKDGLKTVKDKGATFGIFVFADKDDPCTVGVYPEQRFGYVNVAAVGGDDERLVRELKRAFVMLCGSSSSQYDGTLLSPVEGPLDLDGIKEKKLPMDVISRVEKYLKYFEVTPYIRTSYKTACEEGWAPNPTNDIQKAIWDKVHELPSNPIQIKYDAKRDAGK